MNNIHPSCSGRVAIALGLGFQLMPLGGCGGVEDELDGQSASLVMDNGLSTNGLSTNGLSTNGLSTNGLSTNGLSTSSFKAWWSANAPSVSELVMRYVVHCAVPAGQQRTFRSPAGVTYVWTGEFGLAPRWTAGAPATQVEQQLVSACLAAHVNKFGVSVPFSLLGYDSTGTAIPVGKTELSDYAVREGCFFGNLFNGEGVFVGNDANWTTAISSLRECAIITRGSGSTNCPPMLYAGECSKLCSPGAAYNNYRTCWYNGKSYPVLSTRVARDIINRCGDGICQLSEQCGTGKTPDDCRDCGPCI